MLDLKKKDQVQKYEMELVENEKQEYKLFGSFMRTKGLKLFSYNHLRDELLEVEIQKDDEVNVVLENGKLKGKSSLQVEAKITTSNTHFEALNFRTATNRIKKFKKGIVKDLCNLKPYNPQPIYNF